MADKENPIQLDPKKKGAFTKYCKGLGEKGVTQKCINKGKQSDNELTRRRAQFAENARKFNH